MKTSTIALLSILAITAVLLVFDAALGALFVFLEIIVAIGYLTRKKCSNCGARGTIKFTGSQIVDQRQGYGIVTRRDQIRSRNRQYGRNDQVETTVVERQERVPTVTETTRSLYECSKCENRTYVDRVSNHEDFSRSVNEPTRIIRNTHEKVIEREVVRVPCSYCGVLLDPVRDQFCQKCGAKVVLNR